MAANKNICTVGATCRNTLQHNRQPQTKYVCFLGRRCACTLCLRNVSPLAYEKLRTSEKSGAHVGSYLQPNAAGGVGASGGQQAQAFVAVHRDGMATVQTGGTDRV